VAHLAAIFRVETISCERQDRSVLISPRKEYVEGTWARIAGLLSFEYQFIWQLPCRDNEVERRTGCSSYLTWRINEIREDGLDKLTYLSVIAD